MAGATNELVLIGGGNMGSALLGGLVAAGWDPAGIVVVELDATKRAALERQFGVRTSSETVAGNGAVIAVKPGDAAAVCAEVAALGTPRALSIAAGISASTLQDAAGPDCAVVRAMPNTPAAVQRGITAIASDSGLAEADVVRAEQLFSSVGTTVRVPESLFDAVTAVSGSGPAFLFRFLEAWAYAAEEIGLPPETAKVLARETLIGAAALLDETKEEPEVLRAKVTSKGGTTAAGMLRLDDTAARSGGLDALMVETLRAARDRGVELGRS